jgi:hypothetical protein
MAILHWKQRLVYDYTFSDYRRFGKVKKDIRLKYKAGHAGVTVDGDGRLVPLIKAFHAVACPRCH